MKARNDYLALQLSLCLIEHRVHIESANFRFVIGLLAACLFIVLSFVHAIYFMRLLNIMLLINR